MAKKFDYSYWVTLWKAVKNGAIAFVPAYLAFLASVPAEYSWLAGILALGIKNWLKNKKGWNV